MNRIAPTLVILTALLLPTLAPAGHLPGRVAGDIDGDGVPNNVECPPPYDPADAPDQENDGIADCYDPDDDGDGIPTIEEGEGGQ